MIKDGISRNIATTFLAGALALGSYNTNAQVSTNLVNSGLEGKISSHNAVESKGTRYLLALNGDEGEFAEAHRYNVHDSFRAVLKQNFPDTNLFSISPKSVKPTRNNVFAIFNELANVVNKDDTVVVYTTGHGVANNGMGYLQLSGKTGENYITSKELVGCMKKLNNAKIVYVGDQCYSGAFLNEIKNSGLNAVGAVNTDADHAVTNYFTFSLPFWKAMGGEIVNKTMDRKFNMVNTTNKIDSVKAAFDYAVKQNQIEGRTDYKNWQFYESPGMENFSIGSK